MTEWIKRIVPLLVILVLVPVTGYGKSKPDQVRIDMTQWYRKDHRECKGPTVMTIEDGSVHIVSERSTGLFWQIPSLTDGPVILDPNVHTWLKKCERPPRSFNDDIQAAGFKDFLQVGDYPYMSWRWKVDYSTIGEQKVRKSGRLEKKYDDFNGKIGISILKKGSSTIREVAYVWSNTLPESLMFKTETTIIPLVWKMKWRRFVVESGVGNFGKWVLESRNLYEDYKKGYPGEEPGKILRVYVMTDSDNTIGKAATWYSDIVFHRDEPGITGEGGE
jgi:hypothetical protein